MMVFFLPNAGRLSLFQKNIFLFSYVTPFGYEKLANEGTIKFSGKFGAISPYPQLSVTFQRAIHFKIIIMQRLPHHVY